MTTATAPELLYVAPSTMFVDGNIRRAATLDPLLVDSIRDNGVLVPIVAVRNADGGLLVRLGQRRTLAAIEAGDQPVPVFIAGLADDDEATRVVEQWAENEHRAPLVTADRIAAVQQLSLLGVSADDIVKRTKATRVDVDQALAAAASERAREALEQHTELTLDHAAAVAEFDDLPDVADSLVETALERPGSFAFAAQRARDDRARLEKVAAETTRLREAGVRLVDQDVVGYYDQPTKAVRRLNVLEAPGGKALNGTTHKKCPGHAAYVDREGSAQYVCTDWKGNGHRGRYDSAPPREQLSDDETEKAKAERRTVIDNNKAWSTAETVRREWLTKFLTARTPPKGTGKFLAAQLIEIRLAPSEFQTQGNCGALACKLLGHADSREYSAAAARASDARATVMALGVVLANYENNTDRMHWRSVRPDTKAYLEFLEANGYDLADVEKLACGRKLGRRPTKAAAK